MCIVPLSDNLFRSHVLCFRATIVWPTSTHYELAYAIEHDCIVITIRCITCMEQTMQSLQWTTWSHLPVVLHRTFVFFSPFLGLNAYYYWYLQFLINVFSIKTKVLLHESYVTKLRFSSISHVINFAIFFRPLVFLLTRLLNYMVFKYFGFERTWWRLFGFERSWWRLFGFERSWWRLFGFERSWWRLFQTHVVRNKFDIYVFISNLFFYLLEACALIVEEVFYYGVRNSSKQTHKITCMIVIR